MINMNYDYIHNTGLSKDNSLVHLIDSLNENMEEEINTIEHSRYYELGIEFVRITSSPRNLSIINLNCQCFNAKFDDELPIFISEICNNSGIDVITLQESLGYEPAGLTVHPPPRMIESGFIFFVWVSSAIKIFSSKKKWIL